MTAATMIAYIKAADSSSRASAARRSDCRSSSKADGINPMIVSKAKDTMAIANSVSARVKAEHLVNGFLVPGSWFWDAQPKELQSANRTGNREPGKGNPLTILTA